jgi:hypothetical protein
VTLGVPRPADTWIFPFGAKDDGLHESYVLYNPSDDEATVEVAVTLVEPELNGEVDPFSVTVNPRSWTTLDLDLEDRIPTRVAHASVVTARNEVPIVVERVVHSNDPLETSDVAISPGAPLIADRWIFAAGGSIRGQLAEWIAVTNPRSAPVDVQLGAVIDGQVRALDEDASFTLGPREHRRIRLPASLDAERVTMQLFADQPVAAERILIRPEGARTSTAPGVPAGDGEVRLAPRTAAG